MFRTIAVGGCDFRWTKNLSLSVFLTITCIFGIGVPYWILPVPAAIEESAPAKARLAVVDSALPEKAWTGILDNLQRTFNLPNNLAISEPDYTTFLIHALVNCQKFTVLERKKLKLAAKEIEFGASDYANQEKCVKIGKMLNAQYLVIPEVRDMVIEISVRPIPFLEQLQTNCSGSMGIGLRMFEVATGRIVNSSIDRESKTIPIGYAGTSPAKQALALIDNLLLESARKETIKIIDFEYPLEVVDGVGEKIGDQVVLNRGQQAIEKGEVFIVYNVGAPIVDEQTKESLGREQTEAGKIKIIRTEPKMCVGQIVSLEPGKTIKKPDIAGRAHKPPK